MRKMTVALLSEPCAKFPSKYELVLKSDKKLAEICAKYNKINILNWFSLIMDYAPHIEKSWCVSIFPIVDNITANECISCGLTETEVLSMGNMRHIMREGRTEVDSNLIWTIIFCFGYAIAESYNTSKAKKAIKELETYVPVDKLRDILILIGLECPISAGLIQFFSTIKQ